MFRGATRRNPPAAIQLGGLRRACAAILPARRARRLNPPYEGLGRPHPVDEVIDLGAQQVRLPGEVDRGGDDLVRHPVGFARRLAHARDGARHRLRAQRGLVDVAVDFAGGGVRLVRRGRNRRRDVVDVVDGLADRPDGGDDLAGAALDGVDLARDVLGRLGGLHRQVFYLLCHHGETAAGFAGARRLDGGIERQQVGLLGNRRDELHHLADALGGGGEAFGNAAGGLGLLDGGPGNVGGRRDLLTDLADRGGQLFRRASDGLDVVGGLVGRGRHDVGLAAGLVGGLAHRGGVLLELGGGGRNGAHHAHYVGFEGLRQRLHGGLLLGGGAVLLRRLLLLDRLHRDGVLLEHLHRARHGADLVGAVAAGNLGIEVAVGERVHRPRQPPQQRPDRAQ